MSEGRRGAVRSEAARTAVLAATSSLIERLGYERVTIEGIASEAGVGKQTIYRWWPSKSAVVAECLLEGALLPETFARFAAAFTHRRSGRKRGGRGTARRTPRRLP
jgi:AcrR family transcriptional regulator